MGYYLKEHRVRPVPGREQHTHACSIHAKQCLCSRAGDLQHRSKGGNADRVNISELEK